MECREFGKYTLLNLMGKGGVGSVYRASDNDAGIVLAIKIFEPGERRPFKTVRSLRDREVRMLISIQHPNVVRYYDSGEIDGACYYTMEFVEDTLHNHMHNRTGELQLSDKIHILRQICNALQAIHHQGIVHRDIKPANILLDQAPSGAFHVKVTDLGIAKRVSEMKEAERRRRRATRVPGTPKYLSPEQIRLKPVDGRADVFSLGITAYELLTGRPPFKARDTDGYLKANLEQEPLPAHRANRDIPSFISPVIAKMMAKDREERYDSDTLARDMELIYQHLISAAGLVERKNPESVFFVPETPVVREGSLPTRRRTLPDWRLFVGWPQIAAVTMVVGLTGLYMFLVWPDMPPRPDRADPQRLTGVRDFPPEEALQAAGRMLETGAYWRALQLLESIRSDALDEEQHERRGTMLETVHNALAEPFIAEARARIHEGEPREAEVLLRRARERFPRATDTDDLMERLLNMRLRGIY